MSYDTSRHPRFALVLHSFYPSRISLSVSFSFLSISLVLSRSQSLIHRDTGLIVSLVASMVDVTHKPNNNNNVNPRLSQLVPPLVYLFLLVHSCFLRLSRSLRIILAARSLRLMKRQTDRGISPHCAAIIPVTRDTPGKVSQMKS